jgi:transposase
LGISPSQSQSPLRNDLDRARAAAAWFGGLSQRAIARQLGYRTKAPVSVGIKHFLETYGDGLCPSDPEQRKAMIPTALTRFAKETGIIVALSAAAPAPPIPPLQRDANRAYAAGRWALGKTQHEIAAEFGVSGGVVHLAIRRFLKKFGDPEEEWMQAKARVEGALRRFQSMHGRHALVIDAMTAEEFRVPARHASSPPG